MGWRCRKQPTADLGGLGNHVFGLPPKRHGRRLPAIGILRCSAAIRAKSGNQFSKVLDGIHSPRHSRQLERSRLDPATLGRSGLLRPVCRSHCGAVDPRGSGSTGLRLHRRCVQLVFPVRRHPRRLVAADGHGLRTRDRPSSGHAARSVLRRPCQVPVPRDLTAALLGPRPYRDPANPQSAQLSGVAQHPRDAVRDLPDLRRLHRQQPERAPPCPRRQVYDRRGFRGRYAVLLSDHDLVPLGTDPSDDEFRIRAGLLLLGLQPQGRCGRVHRAELHDQAAAVPVPGLGAAAAPDGFCHRAGRHARLRRTALPHSLRLGQQRLLPGGAPVHCTGAARRSGTTAPSTAS